MPFPASGQASFRFVAHRFDPRTGTASLDYAYGEGPVFTETLVFPLPPAGLPAANRPAFERALALLHLVAGVSYYKAFLPAQIDTGPHQLDPATAGFLERLYVQGLAEFAHRNSLDLAGRICFPAAIPEPAAVTAACELSEQACVAMGGGKDSLVSLALLRSAGIETLPATVGGSALIAETVAVAGLPLLTVRRTLAPELLAWNAAGAWNGHVPVTAINSLVLVCLALLHGCRFVVFSNERSADEATLVNERGEAVNHQYSKSLVFERDLRALLRLHLASPPDYFSLLRPLGELAVTQRFAQLTVFHPVFSSCNRNFHREGSRIARGRWCGDCPKCRFTTLALAPFLEVAAVVAILGVNLLDQPGQADGFRELCGLTAHKPFECVGTTAECQAALLAAAARPGWRDCAVVSALAAELAERGLDRDAQAALAEQLRTGGEHCIPPGILSRVAL